MLAKEDLAGLSRSVSFQLPLDGAGSGSGVRQQDRVALPTGRSTMCTSRCQSDSHKQSSIRNSSRKPVELI
jgi:hypothetical protein